MDIISLLNLNTHNQSFLFVIYSFSLFLNQSQQMGRHLKVHHDGADVHNRCDQRRRHNSRIHVKLSWQNNGSTHPIILAIKIVATREMDTRSANIGSR